MRGHRSVVRPFVSPAQLIQEQHDFRDPLLIQHLDKERRSAVGNFKRLFVRVGRLLPRLPDAAQLTPRQLHRAEQMESCEREKSSRLTAALAGAPDALERVLRDILTLVGRQVTVVSFEDSRERSAKLVACTPLSFRTLLA